MFRIGQRAIGDGHPCFVTFEAGPTHTGVDSAKELTRLAAAAGADAIKFQIIDPDRLVQDRQQLFSYSVLVDRETGETEEVTESLYDLFVRRALSHEQWREVKAEADEVGLTFFATAAFAEEIDLLEEIGCHSIKIASADVNHYPLIRRAARTGQVIQLDTGNATLGEIEAAVDVVLAEGNDKIIIHQCPSGYPARLDSINLNLITTLKKMFPFPIAYSDHTPGWDMDVAALAMGANLVEKTITKDRTARSVEHIFSLEPDDANRFVQVIRDVEKAFGSHRRHMTPEELAKRKMIRRSCFYRQAIAAGTELTEDMLEYRRPGTGIGPESHDALIGRRLGVDVAAGSMVQWGHLIDE